MYESELARLIKLVIYSILGMGDIDIYVILSHLRSMGTIVHYKSDVAQLGSNAQLSTLVECSNKLLPHIPATLVSVLIIH